MPKATTASTVDKSIPSPVPEQKVQKETILEYLKALNFDKTLSEAEKSHFIQTALSNNLDPFRREIYLAVYGEGEYRKVSILTGYQVYLKRAERTGKLDGWNVSITGEKDAMKAIVEIFRKDWSNSFTHEVFWVEAAQKKKDGSLTAFWLKQPRFQLKKVAIAQAFRFAFPDEVGSLPYDSSELPNTESAGPPEVTAVTTQKTGKAVIDKPVKTSNRKAYADELAEEMLGENIPPDNKTVSVQPTKSVPAPETGAEADGEPNDIPLMARSPEQLRQMVENILDNNPDAFTEKHRNWILDKTDKANSNAEIIKMLGYASKVIQKTNQEHKAVA
jgi:phage recombination protein Bet